MRTKFTVSILGVLVFARLSIQAGTVEGLDAQLKLNQVQYIGTHNSYHIAPGEASAILLQAVGFDAGEGWSAERLNVALDYTHPPLETQLALGLRQFELDVYADPEGGRFAEPGILQLRNGTPWKLSERYDPMGQLNEPGFKVLHNPEYDPRSTCYLLKKWMREMGDWSALHPNHLPLIVHIEVKQGSPKSLSPDIEPAPIDRFDSVTWRMLETEIRESLPAGKIVTPDDIRGDYKDLRSSILADGWPKLGELRGKFLFFLLTKKPITESYLSLEPKLRGRLFFASVGPEHPSASWFRIPDPSYADIPKLLESGFLVTTMADKYTLAARTDDPTQRDQAFLSGAQFLLTDFPVPQPEFSSYRVVFEGNRYQRPNPVTTIPSIEN